MYSRRVAVRAVLQDVSGRQGIGLLQEKDEQIGQPDTSKRSWPQAHVGANMDNSRPGHIFWCIETGTVVCYDLRR